ncbi:hypothetical protein [Halovivax cerinus]|uniref:Uncharacterized protein n=1 Tax=Halovivax cerinus TaxID=1487865 RepID=A0ABD5NKB8_9EURY|nr:hypothetical protein [Halovivax cerinus]
MAGWYLDRRIRTCVVVVLIVSVTFFYLPTIFFVDVTHSAAGFLAGRLGGTTLKGVISGFVGGLLVAAGWLALTTITGDLSGATLLSIALIPFYTTLFGTIGGATGKVV